MRLCFLKKFLLSPVLVASCLAALMQPGRACSYSDPDVAIVNPASGEAIIIAYEVCRTGLRIPDLTGWSEGTCLIKNTCGGTARQVAWKADFKTGKISLIPYDDETDFFCRRSPFRAAGRLYHFNLHHPENVSPDVASPFSACTVYPEPAPAGEIVKRQIVFGTDDFAIGLPDGWTYVTEPVNCRRGIRHGEKFLNFAEKKPVFISPDGNVCPRH